MPLSEYVDRFLGYLSRLFQLHALYEGESESSGLSHNEIYSYLWYCSLRSNTKGYGGKTHWSDSQNGDTTAPSGEELYHLQFSLQAASPETFEYTLV
jgi:hypothetical protein